MRQSNLKKVFALFLIISVCLSLSISTAAAETKAVLKTESEPNNTITTANVVNQDDTIYGTIGSTTDVDFFRVSFPLAGTANFWLGDIPSGKDYDLYVYNSSGTLVGSSTGTTSSELVSLSVSANSTYYFKVQGCNNSYSTTSKYRVRSRLVLGTYNYFCQGTPSYSSPSYSTNNLDILYYKTTSGETSAKSYLERIKNAGCVASSYAMILRNLGAKTTSNQYDVRTGSTYKLNADPFTVSYSNTLFPSITYSSGSGIYIANTTRDPVFMFHSDALGGFGKTYTQYSLSGTDTSKANAIAYQLSLHPEGVAVSFEKNSNTHTVVFIATTHDVPLSYTFPNSTALSADILCETESLTPNVTEESVLAWEQAYLNKIASTNASAFDSKFTVCDPVSTATVSGNQVLFGNAYIANAYGFSSAYRILVVNN